MTPETEMILALARIREAVDDFGLEAVRKAMEQAEDDAKERSCIDDRPTPASNE